MTAQQTDQSTTSGIASGYTMTKTTTGTPHNPSPVAKSIRDLCNSAVTHCVRFIRDTTDPTANVLTVHYNQLKPAQTPEEAQGQPPAVPRQCPIAEQ
ncbi:hypothetical protein AHF37_10642 [Paragonimus kellicotti]|nr:hypothetical protein AHF37_10642 [Paragonimus kellicotti]